MKAINDISKDVFNVYSEVILNYLRQAYPDRYVGPGSVEYEKVIRLSALQHASLGMELEDIQNNFSLNKMAEQDNPDLEMAKSIASNYLVAYNVGTYSSGQVSVVTGNTTYVVIPADSVFSAGTVDLVTDKTYIGVLNLPPNPVTNDTEYVKMSQNSEGNYILSFPVRASEPGTVEIGSGEAVEPGFQNNHIIASYISSSVSGGSEAESVQNYIDRIPSSVAAKIPSGAAHINALLTAVPGVSIVSSKVIGGGDPEMKRDKETIFGIPGGKVDIYCKTQKYPAEKTYRATGVSVGDGIWEVKIPVTEAYGFMYVTSVTDANGASLNVENIEVSLNVQDSEKNKMAGSRDGWLSSYCEVVLRMPHTLTGSVFTFDVSFMYMPAIKTLQDYFNEGEASTPFADILVRSAVPCPVSVYAKISNMESETVIKAAISSAINSLPVGHGTLDAGDIIGAIRYAETNADLEFPVSLRLDIKTYSNNIISVNSPETGSISVPEYPDYNIYKTNSFFTVNSDNIHLESV